MYPPDYAGMVKALLTVFTQFGLLQSDAPTYLILSAAGNAAFYFLPVFLGITLAKQFGGNAYVGGGIGAALLDPNFTGLLAIHKPLLPYPRQNLSGSGA